MEQVKKRVKNQFYKSKAGFLSELKRHDLNSSKKTYFVIVQNLFFDILVPK